MIKKKRRKRKEGDCNGGGGNILLFATCFGRVLRCTIHRRRNNSGTRNWSPMFVVFIMTCKRKCFMFNTTLFGPRDMKTNGLVIFWNRNTIVSFTKLRDQFILALQTTKCDFTNFLTFMPFPFLFMKFSVKSN